MEKPMLTQRQDGFCRAYIETGCGAEAYGRAYPRSQNWAAAAVHVAGSRMLAIPKVQLRVAELRGKAAEKAVLNEAWVLERLMKNVRIAMGEELVTVVVSSTDKTTGAVRTVEVQKSARDAAAANRALELLGKKLDMFKERPAVEVVAQVQRIERVIVDPAFPVNA
jgi:phage terminase small subunit